MAHTSERAGPSSRCWRVPDNPARGPRPPIHVPEMLTAQISSQIRIYKQFMAQEQDEDLVRALDRKNPPSMLGSEKFISRTKNRFFKKKIDKEVPASKQPVPVLG